MDVLKEEARGRLKYDRKRIYVNIRLLLSSGEWALVLATCSFAAAGTLLPRKAQSTYGESERMSIIFSAEE